MVVVSAVALSEKVPDPALRPHSFTLRVGELLDLDECAARAGGGRVRARRPGRGARPVRAARRAARRVPGDRGAGGAGGHVRRRDRIAALVLDLHPALARRCRGGRDRARGRARARAPRARRDRRAIAAPFRRSATRRAERPDIAELLPVERFGALLDLLGEDTELLVAAEEELTPALERPLDRRVRRVRRRGRPPPVREPRADRSRRSRARARIWLSAISSDQPIELRAQAADTAARSLAEAEPELEKLVRSRLPHRRRVPPPRRGRARRLQPRAPESHLAGRGAWTSARQVARARRCASPRRRCARASSRPS